MAKSTNTQTNSKGEKVSVLETEQGYEVWNHEAGEHIGIAGDPESARQMREG